MLYKKLNSISLLFPLSLILIGVSVAFTRVIELEVIGVLMVLIGAFGFLLLASVYSYRQDKAKGGKVKLIYYILASIGLVILRVLLRG